MSQRTFRDNSHTHGSSQIVYSRSSIRTFEATKVRTRSLNVLQPVMTSQQAMLEFERAFGQTVDKFLNRDKELYIYGKCKTKERLNALIQLLESNYEIPRWSGGLWLGGNGMRAAGAKHLATMLAKNTTIHTLDLDGNDMKAAGAKNLATMFETNTTIHTLHLGANHIGDAGAKDFATMLEKNTTIHTLDLRGNSIGPAGAKDLATMLGTNTTIHTLKLQNNNIGADGVKDFEVMLAKNVTIQEIDFHGKPTPMKNALARNKDDRAAFQHAVNIKHSQAIELLLEKHHKSLDFEKELVARIWNAVSQNNRIPKQTTLKILVDLALQSDASELLHELLHHLDEFSLVQLLPDLDDVALAHLQTDSRSEIRNMGEIALTPVDSFDPSRLAQQLTALLPFTTDMFDEDGTPLPTIFLSNDPTLISKLRIDLAAASVRYLLERQLKHEIKTWVDAHPGTNTLMTGLDVTKSAEKHLERYADTPLDSQQTSASLDRMVVPEWYDQVLVQPAVEAVRSQLEQRRVAALADTTQTDTCQQLAKESLEADRQLYGGALSKAQQQDRPATNKMELLAAQRELQIRDTWATNPDTGKPQRPTHPNMPASTTVAQVKLQAVQQGGAFRKVIKSMRVATGLSLSMVKGSVDRDSGLLRKYKGHVDNQESSLYMSKGSYRIAQKLWVRGNVRSICDVNRALFVADTFEDLFKAAEHICSRSDICIVDVKDRVNNPTYGGWSDLVLLFSVEGTIGHIHELQLALSPMMVARGAMAAHEAYARARYFVEMLQKCDLQYDSESLESKQQKIIEKLNNVIEDQKKQIEDQKQQIEGQKQQNGALKQRNKYQKQQNEDQKQQIEDRTQQNEDQKQQNEALNQQNEDQKQQIKGQKQQIKAQKQQNEAQKQQNENQKQQNENQKQQIKGHKQLNETQEHLKKAQKQQNAKLKQQNEDLKRRGRTLCGWLQQAEGEKKKWKRSWFVLSNGWLTYHDSNKVKSSMSILKRINIAKGGMPISICTITLDSDSSQLHKFTITNESEGTHIYLDKSNKFERPDETHTRKEWVDTMLTHTGCKMVR